MTNSTTFPGTVTATGFTGTATNATNAVLATDATNASRPVIFGTGTTGNVPLKTDPGIVYNPSTNKLTAGAFVGDGSELTGISAGFDPDVDTIKIGNGAGTTQQGASAIAIGHDAGSSGQVTEAIAIGVEAGCNAQGASSVAIGRLAACADQSNDSVAIGTRAARADQGTMAVAIGTNAGSNTQGGSSVAIGINSGCGDQAASSVAIGHSAAEAAQGGECVAIGNTAGKTSQGGTAVAIGKAAGRQSQGANSVAIGTYAASTTQGVYSVAIGYQTARYAQGNFCIAMGYVSGNNQQGDQSIAIGGTSAGYTSQGHDAVAIGQGAGGNKQSVDQICINKGSTALNGVQNHTAIRLGGSSSGQYVQHTQDNGICFWVNSDDRMKDDERMITNALDTVMKLKPQLYEKRTKLDPGSRSLCTEAGIMAQDVWYDTPELRPFVNLPPTANPAEEKPLAPSGDPRDDPDYSDWGSKPANISEYFLPYYNLRALQELATEKPRSKTTVSNTWGQNISSLVVSANTNKFKANTVPIVALSNVTMDKASYGIVSDVNCLHTDDYDVLVDVKGDTRVWVSDVGGNIQSGDLLTTSNIAPGYAQKQNDDIIHNYTVAKVTQDCDFTEPAQIPIMRRKQELKDVTYYLRKDEMPIDYAEYMEIVDPTLKTTHTEIVYRKPDGGLEYYEDTTTNIEVCRTWYDKLPEDKRYKSMIFEISESEYEKLSDFEKEKYTRHEKIKYYKYAIFTSKINKRTHPITEVHQEMVDVLDENQQIVWEESGQTQPIYTLVNHETHKAALVNCKLF